MPLKKKIYDFLENQKLIYVGTILLTLVGFYLRYKRRIVTPLNRDELWVVNHINRSDSFLDFVGKLPHLEFSSYLSGDYYLLYPFVKIFGINIWAVAMPHILFTILCFYFLFLVCRLHLKNIIGFFIAFAIVSFNSTLIIHSFELRYYAVLQTLGLMTYYYTYLLVYRPQSLTKLKLVTMGAFFCFSILFHFYSVIMVCANIAFFLAIHISHKSVMETAKKLIPFFALVFLIVGPILYLVLFAWTHLPSGMWGNQTFSFIPNPLNDPIEFLKGIFCNLIGYKNLYFLFAGLIISFCFPHKDRNHQLWFLLILILLPIALLLLLDLKGGYWFIQTQFIWIMPLFAVLLGWCWESILLRLYPKN